jgi:WhiB family transcriptional regulator, redox-sensing transcriptional regulator
MIKRTLRSRRHDLAESDRSAELDATVTPGLTDAAPTAAVVTTNEFGRPLELCLVEPDPDSPTAWMAEGNCRLYPPAVFFPSDGVGVDRARKICRDCPVSSRCLEYALDERIEHGVWGGCSERERRRILKRRRDETDTLVALA